MQPNTASRVSRMARPSVPYLPTFSSIQPSQCSSFSSSNRKLRNTSSRKAPPKAATSAWWAVRLRAYSSGVLMAMCQTSTRPRPVATDTISSGNSRRMPNTATRMPTVRNSLRQNAFQLRSTEALTTALSKDSDTSSTPSTAAIHRPAAGRRRRRGRSPTSRPAPAGRR